MKRFAVAVYFHFKPEGLFAGEKFSLSVSVVPADDKDTAKSLAVSKAKQEISSGAPDLSTMNIVAMEISDQ